MVGGLLAWNIILFYIDEKFNECNVMTDISALYPPRLWSWFATICSIPHGSYNEEALASHIATWAKSKNLTVYRDGVGNVLITKPATKGYESHAPIALQAHLDMVCQANSDYDFEKSPIIPIIDGEWVRADGTTLGADNGIGLASILAVLDGDDLQHPMIEAVLTMTEETGMVGAIGLERHRLKSTMMINTDTEEIGEIYLGCAGGIDADIRCEMNFEKLSHETVFEFEIKGLKGGHSGIDIHKNNSNAIKLIAYVLARVGGVRLIEFKGGTARNAIPRMASVKVAVADKDGFMNKIKEVADEVMDLIKDYETGATYKISEIHSDVEALSLAQSTNIIHFISALPNGVIRNSDKVADTVETSLSLGKINLDKQGLHATSLIRSLNDVGKRTAIQAVQSVCELAGVGVEFSGDYVGWEPNPDSTITQITHKVYADVMGREPKFKVIHAGLECGLIQQAYPTMDIVSIGPTIKNAHSPDECVHIESVATYWQVLTGVLANAPRLTL